jgi:glucose/arabinose dehydrogenase
MRRLAVLSAIAMVAGIAPASAQVAVPVVRLTPVAAFEIPVAMTTRTGDDTLYFIEKVGRVRAVRGGLIDPTPVLDLTSEVSNGLEQGLLGLAFSADGGLLYLNLTDGGGDTHILEFAMIGSVADPATRRELLFVDQPFENHNGGHLEFGPDGYLYIGLGDGGSAGDPFGNAQNLDSLLGKMLRIDPAPSDGAAYTVPSDNPFIGTAGARPEIWAYGLRNPWMFTFDREGGDLWIGDVGQGVWEEIDLQRAESGGGENYGWDQMEGTHPYQGGQPPADHVPPVYEYPHENGACSITGGHVYRGSKIPALRGAYVYSDWCDGKLRYVRESEGVVTEAGELGAFVPLVTSFGEDTDGELYAMSLAGPVFRIDPLLL